MITLKLAMLVMLMMTGGYNILPVQTKIMHTPMEYTKTQIEVLNEEALPAALVEKNEEPVTINQDKTYEQCMKEAFERIYEEVNRLLDQISNQTDEQFQL